MISMFTVVYLVQVTCYFKEKTELKLFFSCIFQLTWGTFVLRCTVTVSGGFSPFFLIVLEINITVKKGNWKCMHVCLLLFFF